MEFALSLGADAAFNTLTYTGPIESASSTLVVSGANAAYQSALGMTSNHGVVLGIGLPAGGVVIDGMFSYPFLTSSQSWAKP